MSGKNHTCTQQGNKQKMTKARINWCIKFGSTPKSESNGNLGPFVPKPFKPSGKQNQLISVREMENQAMWNTINALALFVFRSVIFFALFGSMFRLGFRPFCIRPFCIRPFAFASIVIRPF